MHDKLIMFNLHDINGICNIIMDARLCAIRREEGRSNLRLNPPARRRFGCIGTGILGNNRELIPQLKLRYFFI